MARSRSEKAIARLHSCASDAGQDQGMRVAFDEQIFAIPSRVAKLSLPDGQMPGDYGNGVRPGAGGRAWSFKYP